MFCRECITGCLGSGLGVAQCPVCREPVRRQELITVPRASRFSVDLDTHWRPSSKIKALMKDLTKTLAEPLPPPERPLRAGQRPVAKCVVVSQWTAMLDLVQRPLEAERLPFARLDGSMAQPARSAALARFASDAKCQVLLLSLRAGGIGLNLVAAQTLYLLDPWWNPAVEEQAINRVHRIGQSFPVKIKRFIMRDSVEEKMLVVQERKAAIVKGALETSKEEARAMRVEDLKMMFR